MRLSDRRRGQNYGFTDEQKAKIVKLYTDRNHGLMPVTLAARYGCSSSTIKDILEAAGVYRPMRKPSRKA